MIKTVKRLYKIVETRQQDEGHIILLDDRPVKTKMGHFLATPVKPIADALVLEWERQPDFIQPETMPLTQIINTKLDLISTERSVMTEAILKYLDTDLLCYIAAEPDDLVAAQEIAWLPWREWFYLRAGVRLNTTTGLYALRQEKVAHDFLHKVIAALDDDGFTILQIVTPLCGSVVLGLAFAEGVAMPEDILSACFVEETYKESLYDSAKYGQDPMLEKKQIAMKRDLEAAAFYIQCIKGDPVPQESRVLRGSSRE